MAAVAEVVLIVVGLIVLSDIPCGGAGTRILERTQLAGRCRQKTREVKQNPVRRIREGEEGQYITRIVVE